MLNAGQAQGSVGQDAAYDPSISNKRSTERTVVRPDKFELELINSFQQELNNCHSRIYDLERKIARYDRAFETMFKEELDSRINGKTVRDMTDACGVSGLDRLRWQAEKARAEGL